MGSSEPPRHLWTGDKVGIGLAVVAFIAVVVLVAY
jgi:hypothetical protein